MKVCHYDDDENRLIGDDCEFDRKNLFEIAAYYEKGEPDYEASLDDVDVDYYIQTKSKDGCFYQAINISEIGDTMILEKGIYDRTQTGFVLSKEHADYVRSVVAKYTDLY